MIAEGGSGISAWVGPGRWRTIAFGLPLALMALAPGACGDLASRDLDTLIVQDSTYVDPTTNEPYTGAVFRQFGHLPDETQLRGSLRDGTWSGELTVYHPSGRVRYQGRMAGGAQCGGWTEMEDDSEPDSDYRALKRELESIVMYPACP